MRIRRRTCSLPHYHRRAPTRKQTLAHPSVANATTLTAATHPNARARSRAHRQARILRLRLRRNRLPSRCTSRNQATRAVILQRPYHRTTHHTATTRCRRQGILYRQCILGRTPRCHHQRARLPHRSRASHRRLRLRTLAIPTPPTPGHTTRNTMRIRTRMRATRLACRGRTTGTRRLRLLRWQALAMRTRMLTMNHALRRAGAPGPSLPSRRLMLGYRLYVIVVQLWCRTMSFLCILVWFSRSPVDSLSR